MVSLIGNDSETPSETASLDLDFFMSSGNGDFLSKDENKGTWKTYKTGENGRKLAQALAENVFTCNYVTWR